MKSIFLALVLLLMSGLATAGQFPARGTPNTCTLTENSDGEYSLTVTGPGRMHPLPVVFFGAEKAEAMYVDPSTGQFATGTKLYNEDPALINGLIHADHIHDVVVNGEHVPCTLHAEKLNPWWQRHLIALILIALALVSIVLYKVKNIYALMFVLPALFFAIYWFAR